MAEMPRQTVIVLDVTLDGDKVHVNITSRPMIPLMSIAELLDKAAEEIRGGRLGSMRINPLGPTSD